MGKDNGEANLSLLEQQTLFAIIRLHPSAYGLTIRDEIKERAGRDVSIGAIYAALERLDEKGFVATREGEAVAKRGGRKKLFFTISGLGQRALRASVQATNNLMAGIEGQVFA